MIKLLWVDCETTGFDPEENDIIQLSGIIEIPGVKSEEFNYRISPINWDSINEEAMSVNGISLDELKTYSSAFEAHWSFKTMLFRWVNPYDPMTRLILCGQNVQFDSMFIQKFCEKQKDLFWRSCITGGTFDLQTLSIAYEIFHDKRIFKSYSLGSICKALGVTLDNAHDAMADIIATRECCLTIWNEIQGE